MKFVNVLKRAREKAAVADISGVDFMAVQINVTGDDPGVFYVEVKDGQVNVEPYEYYDRQCAITISGDDFSKLVRKKLDPVKAFNAGRLTVEGDLDKALEFSNLVRGE